MPKVSDGPKELNDLLEQVYSDCIKKKKNAGYCSRISWTAAENAGWKKNKKGEWKKKSSDEMKKDELIKKGGIKVKIEEE